MAKTKTTAPAKAATAAAEKAPDVIEDCVAYERALVKEHVDETHAVTGTKQHYPKMVYHRKHGATVVHSEDEEGKLPHGYESKPFTASESGE